MTARKCVERLSAEQGHRCAYCGVRMVIPGLDKKPKWPAPASERRAYKFRKATRDHITPRSEGGTDAWENLVAACVWCNGYRANNPAEEAFARIQRRIRRGTHPHQILDKTGWWPKHSGGMRTLEQRSAKSQLECCP